MALPANDKIIGDIGHTADHNAIVDEITFIKDNYLSASGGSLNDFLRKDSASTIYATISSPSFSGIPLAPTAASGTNTTQIATTQFVRSEISALVNSAPPALDTLNELATALGNDANFATTVTELLSNKLDAGIASATYITQSSASSLYFPRSASGGLLTESEASEIYLRQDTASSTYLTSSDAQNLYFPKSASGGLLTEEEASSIYLPISGSFNPEGYLTSSAAAVTYLPISASGQFSTVGYLTASAAEIIYAPLISANLSGSPTAPTPLSESNNNSIATTSFVKDAILAVQTGSAVDLSDYLKKDTASATYLPISASSNYLFVETASTTYLRMDTASAIYLRQDSANATYSEKIINIKTASVDYTATLEDSGTLIKFDSESNIKFIIPDNTSEPFPIGTKIDILQTNIGQVTASANIGVTLNGNPGTMLSGQWAAASIVKLDTDFWVIIGSIE